MNSKKKPGNQTKRNTEQKYSLTRKLIKFVFSTFLVFVIFSFFIIALFRWINPPITAFIQHSYQAEISNIFSNEVKKIRWVPVKNISKYMVLAVIASEDQKFPEHFGFDVVEIEKAIKEKIKGKKLRGASTITQQVAKNLFLWSGKDFVRKILESYYTVVIELIWSKQRIIEVYLNIAEFGPKLYGIENAARKFYHKSAHMLNKYDAAMLSAVLPSPVRFSVLKPSSYVKERQKWILTQMRKLGGLKYVEKILE